MTRTLSAILFLVASVILYLFTEQNIPAESSSDQKDTSSPEGRYEYELNRLMDPATGEIPSNMRMKELAFASSLPRFGAGRDGIMSIDFASIGPYNVGGRTRAFAIDLTDSDVYFAGGVSGGMWKSNDAGQTWKRVTAPEDHAAVSCVSQDPRSGKTDTWYYGSGEVNGNSASKSYSAWYRGSGIYKSTDAGEHWTLLESTTAVVNKESDWDAVFRVLVDPTRNDSDIVLTAMSEGILRSNDGGETWKTSLNANNAGHTDLAVTSDGVFYAAISSNGGNNRGFWRSSDGVNWTEITPTGFPNTHNRTLMSIYGGNESKVYFFSATPGNGTIGNSLWKYEYLSGDGSGSGGTWIDRSSGLPHDDLNLYNGYCHVLAVKPDEEDVVFVGGTNLYRSSNGFADTNATHHIGGYRIEWDTNFTYRSGIHYPDQQSLVFDPADPDVLVSTTDGGIHRTMHAADSGFVWESLSNGYVVSQFYGIAIDHKTSGSEEVMGGLQDRGTFWNNDSDPTDLWTSVRGADGAYCWIEDGGYNQYSSTQYGNVRRTSINENGEYDGWTRLFPESWPNGSGSGFLFVHPFTLDPMDNDIMYLPRSGTIWRNDNLPAADHEDLTHWTQIAAGNNTVTAIAASESQQGVVYYGTSQRTIMRLDNAHQANSITPEWVSEGITSGIYTSCIAIDPEDPDRLIVVYSNYNVIGLWHTEDGGENWEDIEGNLRGTGDDNVPPELNYIGDGPSMRWAEIAKTEDGYVYFLGTSVGLFSTRELDGQNTVWTQEGAETIGNVVVDMLDYREVDQWLVVGTHGNGIYAGNIEFEADTTDTGTSVAQFGKDVSIQLFPNPATDLMTVKLGEAQNGELTILDEMGRAVLYQNFTSGNATIDVHRLKNATYYAKIEFDGQTRILPFIKH